MLFTALLLFQHIVAGDAQNAGRNPYTSAADVEQGRKIFRGQCAGCHGPDGSGGKGADLGVPTLARGETDLALFSTIRYGVPETEMPGHNMTAREVWQVAAFVRSLGAASPETEKGDAVRGSALVRGKGGCLQCHMLGGDGGLLGPGLTDIGRRRSRVFLKRKLLDPSMGLAEGNFRMVSLTTRDGRTLEGIRMNEDTFSIQVRDSAAGLHSFWKHDLADLAVEARTIMPSYSGRFSETELDDVAAYLGGLR
jgi:putative heme-binding domain-containing protein